MNQHAIPPMSKAEKSQYEKLLSYFVYRNGISFRFVVCLSFRKSQQILRADVPLLTVDDLSGRLLDNCFFDIQQQKRRIQLQSTHCALTCDSSMDINDAPARAYFSHQENQSFFEEAIKATVSSRTATMIADEYERIMRGLPENMTCTGGAMDNCSVNKAAWTILKSRFPDKFWYGCASHGLHNFFNDVIARLYSSEDDAHYAKSMIHFVFRQQSVLRELRGLCEKDKTNFTTELSDIRWASACATAKTVLEDEDHLLLVINKGDTDTDDRREYLKRVQNADFMKRLQVMVEILCPAFDLIVKFESDLLPLSDVYAAFQSLKEVYDMMRFIDASEKMIIDEIRRNCWELIYSEAHGIAYLLDPRYLGAKLDADSLDRIKSFIFYTYPYKNQSILEPEAEFCDWLCTWRRYSKEEPRRLNALRKGQMTLYQWWRSQDERRFPHLRELALMVFTLPASSTCRQHTLSHFKSPISDNKATMKLLFVNWNLNLLDKKSRKELESSEEVLDFSDEISSSGIFS